MDDDDDPNMESSFARQQREEFLSKKFGKETFCIIQFIIDNLLVGLRPLRPHIKKIFRLWITREFIEAYQPPSLYKKTDMLVIWNKYSSQIFIEILNISW